MRTRDEVLREYSRPYQSHEDVGGPDADRMADRLRELESQQAASEPVAWALYEGETMLHATTKQTTRNSWQKDVDRGPRMVPLRIVPLYAHPSAAAVTVTEDGEKITMTVGPVTEAEAVAALKRHGWTEQASLFGSFRSLVAPDHPTTPTRGSDE